MKTKISELANTVGNPIAILGAGPSLVGDLEGLPPDVVRISVNHHAAVLGQPDYMAFLDDPHRIRDDCHSFRRFFESYEGRRVSPLVHHSDVILDWPYPDTGFTAAFAAWFGAVIADTGVEVWLCGMDLFQGSPKYFMPREEWPAFHPCWTYPLEKHLNGWKNAAEKIGSGYNIRAASGPLRELFP